MKVSREEEMDFTDRLNIKSQKFRAVFFRPLVRGLNSLGIVAETITLLRLIIAVLIFVLSLCLPIKIFWVSLIFLFVIFLDMVDGTLARSSGTFSDRGKFMDVFVDHTAYCFVVLFLIIKNLTNTPYAAFNLFIIPIAYLLATIKKEEGKPTDWIIKVYPRVVYLQIIPYFAFFSYSFFGYNFLNKAFIISDVWAVVLSFYYYIYITIKWKRNA